MLKCLARGVLSCVAMMNPAALSVTVNDATRTYNGLAWTGGNGVTYNGFVNGESASVLGGTLVYGGTAQGAVNAGSYGLTASGLTSGNYTIGYTAGTLAINPAALSVTATSFAIPMLGEYLPLRYSLGGALAPGDVGVTIFDGLLATNVNTSLPGSYVITQGTLRVVNPNYVLESFTSGTIEVERPTNAPDGGFIEQTLPIAASGEAIGVNRPLDAGSTTVPSGKTHLTVEGDFIRVDVPGN